MTFKPGESGNPDGRPAGSLNKRTQLAKLLEPHAEKLIATMIELALGGDVTALRLCIERLIPKIQHEPMGIELPSDMNEESLFKVKVELVYAVLEGRISVDDAEELTKLIDDTYGKKAAELSMPKITKEMDAVEASRIYQQIMRG